jgi:hypothetical protein
MTELPMVPSNPNGRDRAGKPGLALASLLVVVPVVVAAPIRQPRESTPPSATALLLEPVPAAVVVPGTVPPDGVTGQAAVAALAGGRWLDACRKATAVLAGQVPDVDALGVFAVRGAVGNDRSSVEAALARLREVENPARHRRRNCALRLRWRSRRRRSSRRALPTGSCSPTCAGARATTAGRMRSR